MSVGRTEDIAPDTVVHRVGGSARRQLPGHQRMRERTTQTTVVRELVDAKGRSLGNVSVDRRQCDLLIARFVPGCDFPAVESLFKQFEEAAEAKALSAVDRLDKAIGALRLELSGPEGESSVPVSAVQIWSDGQMSCRVLPSASQDRNGVPVSKP